MSLSRPQPTGHEVPFEIRELFFSRTDERGIIQFGNDVFLNISGFPAEVMIGAPHNIVRHPSMPKAIFKLFWNTLQSGKPIGAYVNNMAANGDHYWVFAVAFPIEGGFLSIRLKPSSALFEKAKSLYAAILNAEAKGGMNAGTEFLTKSLGELGFGSYEQFMAQALSAELESRDRLLAESAATSAAVRSTDRQINRIQEVTNTGSKTFLTIFDNVQAFLQANKIFSTQIETVLVRFKAMRFLSINMTISAEKFGAAAVTLSVISEEFQRVSNDIQNHLLSFMKGAAEISKTIQYSNFNISGLKVQMDMVDFFVRKSLSLANEGTGDFDTAFADLEKNRQAFQQLSSKSVADIRANLSELSGRLAHFGTALGEIRTSAAGLEIIRQMGQMESSRKEEVRVAFQTQIQELQAFTTDLKTVCTELEACTQTLVAASQMIQQAVPVGERSLKAIFALALDTARPRKMAA